MEVESMGARAASRIQGRDLASLVVSSISMRAAPPRLEEGVITALNSFRYSSSASGMEWQGVIRAGDI